MDRRGFGWATLALASAWPIMRAAAYDEKAQENLVARDDRWTRVEASVRGRLGVAVLDMASGVVTGHRLDERFAMCSTFKFVLVALVLARVDAGHASLGQRIVVRRRDLLDWSPVTRQHVGGEGMTVAQLCGAAVSESDNAAANLLLAHFGGPAAVTAFARGIGDDVTRLDRTEPTLNTGTPGDPRDTSTPRAMAATLRKVLLGDALLPASRTLLLEWMTATSTGVARLKAGLPAGWRLAHKTGTGRLGTTNDIGLAWPPAGAPKIVVACLTECDAPVEARERALADVARAMVQG